jgi:hypothetical protein
MEGIMAKTIEVEFELGEMVISKDSIVQRAKGDSNINKIDEAAPVEKIQAEYGKEVFCKKYCVDGRWYLAGELIKKEDARKEALKFLIGRIEAVSA